MNRRTFLGIAAGAFLAACGRRVPAPSPSPRAGDTREAPRAFRAMTYNIHHGEGSDGRIDLERIASVIRQEQADLVALEEVDKGVERTSRRDLCGELSALTGMACLFANNFPYQGGEYGNAILTRFPVKRWTNTHYRMLRTGEQRGVLQALVDAGGRDLLFLATHIDFRPDDAERLQNVRQLEEVLAGYGNVPVLLGGDFNDTPRSRTWQAMAATFDDAWALAGQGDGLTYPSSPVPTKRIDYLWVRRGSPLRPVRARVTATGGSDHLPLTVEFQWR